MNCAIIIRWAVVATWVLSLILAAACGGDSGPSDGDEPPDTTSSVSTPAPPPPAASTAPTTAPERPAPTQARATVPVGHRVGDQAPEFTLALTGDRQVTSAQLVAEGKPVFILFHATW